jgi:hypothetical protein
VYLFFDFLFVLVILVVLIVVLSYTTLFVFGFLIDYNLKRGKNPEKWERLKGIIEKNLRRGK